MGLKGKGNFINKIRRTLFRDKDQEDSGFLSFRVLYLCIFLPPVLYIFTLQGLEKYLHNSWSQEMSARLVSDMTGVATGQIRLQDEVRKNVEQFMAENRLKNLGVVIQTGVRTAQGRQLYPVFSLDPGFADNGGPSGDDHLAELRKTLVAGENISILQEGLVFNMSVRIPHNTWLSNLILIFYILSFSLVLYRSYQSRMIRSQMFREEQNKKLEQARSRLEQAQKALNEFSGKETVYAREMDRLRKDLAAADDRLKITEEEALAELESLEKKLTEATAQREHQEMEILELSDHLEKLSTDLKVLDKKKHKMFNLQHKRFSTLYKKLKFHDRAVQGFLNLPEDLQLKAEELIHTLNEDIKKVSVKRKVFSRGSTTAFETEFGYRGRLYWSRNQQGLAEVMAMGTKKTQSRDLKYIEGVNTS